MDMRDDHEDLVESQTRAINVQIVHSVVSEEEDEDEDEDAMFEEKIRMMTGKPLAPVSSKDVPSKRQHVRMASHNDDDFIPLNSGRPPQSLAKPTKTSVLQTLAYASDEDSEDNVEETAEEADGIAAHIRQNALLGNTANVNNGSHVRSLSYCVVPSIG
jgi:hypothetical protein